MPDLSPTLLYSIIILLLKSNSYRYVFSGRKRQKSGGLLTHSNYLFTQVYLYENGKADQKPVSIKLIRRKTSFKDIARAMRFNQIRVYNSEGS